MKMNQQGFTLLELLAVMAIVSILASIAIPQFSDYRKRAFDTRALSDLRNVATGEEVYFMDHEKYLSCTDIACESLPGASKLSQGVSVQIISASNSESFSGTASHLLGSKKIFKWNSEEGGLIE